MADQFTVFTLLAQVLMHIVISIRIATWGGEGYRFRPWVSRIAFLMAGSSAASAVYILTVIPALTIERINPWNAIFIFVVMLGVIKCRGNLGHFLRR